MQRKTFIRTLAVQLMAAGALFAGAASLLHAQTPVELQFYYPVAVGGPIAKTIDGFATGFMKENPGVKVTPIYAGTYQETIVGADRAQVGHAAGHTVLLSTDMFTLIDEDAIVPSTTS